MKQLVFFLFISISVFSQNYNNIDARVLEYPRFSKVENLAEQIAKDFTSDIDKARAAFFWLTQNIRYNLKELYNPRKRSYHFRYSSEEEKNRKLQAIKDQLISDTFRFKTGVCEEYAQSFKKICDLLQIEAEVIKGYVRNEASEIGILPKTTNHAWNAVNINGKWLVLDATWAAGHEFKGKWIREFNPYFFNISTDKIFKTHYPEDALWVLRFGRMSLADFYQQPIYTNTFLAMKADLVSPKKGIISLNESEYIKLKFTNLEPNSKIFYTLKGNKYALKPTIAVDNGITTLTMKNPNRKSELILYINNSDALHFRLN